MKAALIGYMLRLKFSVYDPYAVLVSIAFQVIFMLLMLSKLKYYWYILRLKVSVHTGEGKIMTPHASVLRQSPDTCGEKKKH